MLSWFWVSAGMNMVGWVSLLTVMLQPNNNDEQRFSVVVHRSVATSLSERNERRGGLTVATCVRCCRGFEEPVLVGMAFGDGW